ncbi:hypothetical protein N9F11_01500 [Akkermansiaceae bacterium]|nr:hypothetical protein [Akkermansiaceae bacterium]
MNISSSLLSSVSQKAAFYFTNEVDELTALDNLNGSIESAILSAGLGFQNDAAFSNMVSLVKMTMAAEQVEVYRAAFPEVRMDQYGNYTTDPTKWA